MRVYLNLKMIIDKMKKQSNSNKHLTTYIVVMLSLLVMSSCGQSNQNSDNTDTSDSLASYVPEFDTVYKWEGKYFGKEHHEEEWSDENREYSLTIKKDSIILKGELFVEPYLLYSKCISSGKIKLLGLKVLDLKDLCGSENILNEDFGVLSIEEEGKKLIWNCDFYLLGPNGEPHILLEENEYRRYVDSMTTAVWGKTNIIDSMYKEQWIGSYIADLHYVKPRGYEDEFDSIEKKLRLEILSDSIKVFINDSVFDALSVYGNADSLFLYTSILWERVQGATNNRLGDLYKDKQGRYIWKSDEDGKHISAIFSFISLVSQNDTSDFYLADDSIILRKQ